MGARGSGRELHVIKFREKGALVVAFVWVSASGRERERERETEPLGGSPLSSQSAPKGPGLQMVLSKVKVKTRKINTLSNNKELTLFPLNKSA